MDDIEICTRRMMCELDMLCESDLEQLQIPPHYHPSLLGSGCNTSCMSW